jgi:hypothetical protein
MNARLTPIACALLLSSLVAPAADAGQQRTPAFRTSSLTLSGAFTGLGHEGGGLRATKAPVKLCTTFRAGYCPAPRP